MADHFALAFVSVSSRGEIGDRKAHQGALNLAVETVPEGRHLVCRFPRGGARRSAARLVVVLVIVRHGPDDRREDDLVCRAGTKSKPPVPPRPRLDDSCCPQTPQNAREHLGADLIVLRDLLDRDEFASAEMEEEYGLHGIVDPFGHPKGRGQLLGGHLGVREGSGLMVNR